MTRAPKMCEDHAKILAAINGYLPATAHHSWALSSELRREGVFPANGSYYKIGGLKVRANLWRELLSANGIVMAEHYRSSYRGRGVKYFGACVIKSRFGETKVERYLQGGVRSCDNAEAKAFYDAQCAEAVQAIHEAIEADGLDAAIALKKSLQKSGDILS